MSIYVQTGLLADCESIIATDENLDDWRNDDWETPELVAKFIASLLKDDEENVLEPAAGTGQIAKYIELTDGRDITCVELNPQRVDCGKFMTRVTKPAWFCESFFDFAEQHMTGAEFLNDGYDVIVTNPPFSLVAEYLKACAKLLAPHGRIIFLLPTAFFQPACRATAVRDAGLHISHQWQIAGRVDYLQNGKVIKGRQCDDSVFEFRLGADGGVIESVDPYGRLLH